MIHALRKILRAGRPGRAVSALPGVGQLKRLVLAGALGMLLPSAALAEVAIDLSKYTATCGVALTRKNASLTAEWTTADGHRCSVDFNLKEGINDVFLNELRISADAAKPAAPIARNIGLTYSLTIGSRTKKAWPYIFFDKVYKEPYDTVPAKLDLSKVRAESIGTSVVLTFSNVSMKPGVTGGAFTGEISCRIFSASPLLQIAANLEPTKPWMAYLYEPVLTGKFPVLAYKAWESREFARISGPTGDPTKLKVRNRIMMAEDPAGTLAIFPPPHAYFYPLDNAFNTGFVQYSANSIGLSQDPTGNNQSAAWIDAPLGKRQVMDMFVLLSPLQAEPTFERAMKYTHGDAFKPIPGYVTYTDHYHNNLTNNELDGDPQPTIFKTAMQEMKVQVVSLAEWRNFPKELDRLVGLKAMFDMCAKYSDANFCLIPGEEPNLWADGHWMYIFPHPVYFHREADRPADLPFMQEIKPYGTVYRPSTEEEMWEMLKRENGLAWTTHPRVKGSEDQPDEYADRGFFKDDKSWLGVDWKALPSDLSEPRLGSRSLDLLNEMCNWGVKKKLLGEVDVFQVDSTRSELYQHMNINYLRLPGIPKSNDWTSVVEVLRRGDYFVSTGEVLILSSSIAKDKVEAELEWTFPPAFAEVIWGEDGKIRRHRIAMDAETEFGRKKFSWPVDLSKAVWARFEVWDVARNGAFIQPVWLKEPVANPPAIQSFSLVDADSDQVIAGFGAIAEGATISLKSLPSKNISFRANASPMGLDNVTFGYDAQAEYSKDKDVPYSVAGEDEWDFKPLPPSLVTPGSHKITATPEKGKGLTLNFNLVE